MNVQEPLPRREAAAAIARCSAVTMRLLARHRTHLPREHVGLRLRFADGTSARVFRETTVDRPPPGEPCLLVVAFRLRRLHGRWHRLFLRECILNTPLFAGFPGLVSKLWLEHDEQERYRGLYEWDDPVAAEHYARSLWRVLDLVCPRGAVQYRVVPGVRRHEALENPELLRPAASSEDRPEWWRVVGVEGAPPGDAGD